MTNLPAADTAALREPRNRVHRRARWYWAVAAGLRWLVLLAVQLLIWLTRDHPSPVHVILFVITLVLAAIHLTVMPQWRYRVHRWEDTPTALYTQSGWISQERRIAPLARIQTVDTHRGPLEQIFGLANVTITTASRRWSAEDPRARPGRRRPTRR